MAEIFSAPEEVEQPKIDFANFDHEQYEAANAEYVQKLKEWLNSMGYKGKNVGEILRLPWADGHAQYMVISMRPCRLMHLPLGDAWDHPDADQLSAERVQEKLDQAKALAELFSKKGGG